MPKKYFLSITNSRGISRNVEITEFSQEEALHWVSLELDSDEEIEGIGFAF